MDNLTVIHDIHTLDNRLILPAGVSISEETLAEVVSSRPAASVRSFPLLDYGSVRNDIVEFLRVPPYTTICPSRVELEALLGRMNGVVLPEPVLDSLDYFKERDFHTYRHSLSVFALSTLIAEDLLAGQLGRLELAAAGPSHDMGKICVPPGILKKPTPLTRAENETLKSHATAGYVLLSYYLGDAGLAAPRVARDHHERKDGSGYPRGIPLADVMVEVVAVCDVYDALISPRPYRPRSYDNRTALEEITSMAERGQIGWEVLGALVARNRKEKQPIAQNPVSREKRGVPPPDNVHGVVTED